MKEMNDADSKNKKIIQIQRKEEEGLMGKDNSKEKRQTFMKALSLPERLSTSSFLKILNTFVTYEEFI